MNKNLFEKFFNGKANKEERNEFLEWIHSEHADKEIECIIENFIESNEYSVNNWNNEDVLTKLNLEIAKTESISPISDRNLSTKTNPPAIPLPVENRHTYNKNRQYRMKWLKIAASIILLASFAAILWKVVQVQKSDIVVSQKTILRKSTERGQKLSFYLDDSTKVMLNSGSELSWQRFNQRDMREVELRGEAFFEVIKNPSKPFIVKTKDIHTTVLGTSFIVRKDTESSTLTVALKSGSVAVQNNSLDENKKIILEPGEKVDINLIDHSNDVSQLDKYESFGWTEGILYFNDDSFEEVVKSLEKWYDVDIAVINDVTTKKYSTTFKNENLENVLIGLSFVNDFEYEINGKNVNIKFK